MTEAQASSRPSSGAGGTRRVDRGSIYLGVSGALLGLSGLLAAAYFLVGGEPSTASAATSERRQDAGPPVADDGGLGKAVETALAGDVSVSAGAITERMRWSDLGAVVDPADLARAGRRSHDLDALRKAGALPVKLDRAKAIAALTALKGKVDRAPVDAYLDLEARAIRDDKAGYGVDVYASLGVVEAAARAGAPAVELATVTLPARTTKASIGIEDISHVLGTFRTEFAVADKERNFNLKLAASKLNGFVLAPKAEFSFNKVVGDRTEKEGYKIAHVITAGEMVDGLAGGTCQISTTLFGASFFAGMEILDATPHSRPSTYVTLGLDSTVVYPTQIYAEVDLKMRNPYDFPVVIHYRVARGEAVVEILGKKRPWDQVAFEREIEEEIPYTSEERPDETLPVGFISLDQPGFNGYRAIRYRKFYKGKKLVKTDKWRLYYKPVKEYLRVGTSVDPNAEIPDEDKAHHLPKAPKQGNGRLVQ